MTKLKSFLNLLLLIVFFVNFSCNSDSEPEIVKEKEEICEKKCEAGFVLDEDLCECEKEPCTKTCDDGFTLNEESCECEKNPCTAVCDSGFTLDEEKCECIQDFVAHVIEVDASSIPMVGDWKKKTDIEGYTGEGYIVWEGPAQFWKGPDKIGTVGRLTYSIDIPRAGTYLFNWRSYIAKKDPLKPNTEHNDSWLRFPGADDFYGVRGASIIYPKGTGKSPNPAGENGNGFFKIYMNDVDKWSLISSTSDNDSHQVYVVFNEAKTYEVEIAARSSFHAIDSFKLTEQKP
ncbi:hypothetical protein [uncultured Algibacter sp.]|uniref:hypothetical protein n=1 Tax=uncultured Algibacter sp. TaxID=298659 RepID=UPI00261BF01C|nr:hypothetical protein [uncultured Algibacter sp.]